MKTLQGIHGYRSLWVINFCMSSFLNFICLKSWHGDSFPPPPKSFPYFIKEKHTLHTLQSYSNALSCNMKPPWLFPKGETFKRKTRALPKEILKGGKKIHSKPFFSFFLSLLPSCLPSFLKVKSNKGPKCCIKAHSFGLKKWNKITFWLKVSSNLAEWFDCKD